MSDETVPLREAFPESEDAADVPRWVRDRREAYEDAGAARAAYEAGRRGRTTDALDEMIAEVRSEMADQSRAVTLAAAMRKSYENGRVARERLEA